MWQTPDGIFYELFSASTSIKVAALLIKIADLPQEHFSPLDPILYYQLFSQASVLLQSGLVLFAGWSRHLSITSSWTLLKVMSIKLVMPSNHLILCHWMAADKRNRNLQLNLTPRYAELGRASLELVGHRWNEVVPWPCEGKEMQRWRRVFRDSSQSRDQTHVSMSPALASGFFTTSTTREAL